MIVKTWMHIKRDSVFFEKIVIGETFSISLKATDEKMIDGKVIEYRNCINPICAYMMPICSFVQLRIEETNK